MPGTHTPPPLELEAEVAALEAQDLDQALTLSHVWIARGAPPGDCRSSLEAKKNCTQQCTSRRRLGRKKKAEKTTTAINAFSQPSVRCKEDSRVKT